MSMIGQIVGIDTPRYRVRIECVDENVYRSFLINVSNPTEQHHARYRGTPIATHSSLQAAEEVILHHCTRFNLLVDRSLFLYIHRDGSAHTLRFSDGFDLNMHMFFVNQGYVVTQENGLIKMLITDYGSYGAEDLTGALAAVRSNRQNLIPVGIIQDVGILGIASIRPTRLVGNVERVPSRTCVVEPMSRNNFPVQVTTAQTAAPRTDAVVGTTAAVTDNRTDSGFEEWLRLPAVHYGIEVMTMPLDADRYRNHYRMTLMRLTKHPAMVGRYTLQENLRILSFETLEACKNGMAAYCVFKSGMVSTPRDERDEWNHILDFLVSVSIDEIQRELNASESTQYGSVRMVLFRMCMTQVGQAGVAESQTQPLPAMPMRRLRLSTMRLANISHIIQPLSSAPEFELPLEEAYLAFEVSTTQWKVKLVFPGVNNEDWRIAEAGTFIGSIVKLNEKIMQRHEELYDQSECQHGGYVSDHFRKLLSQVKVNSILSLLRQRYGRAFPNNFPDRYPHDRFLVDLREIPEIEDFEAPRMAPAEPDEVNSDAKRLHVRYERSEDDEYEEGYCISCRVVVTPGNRYVESRCDTIEHAREAVMAKLESESELFAVRAIVGKVFEHYNTEVIMNRLNKYSEEHNSGLLAITMSRYSLALDNDGDFLINPCVEVELDSERQIMHAVTPMNLMKESGGIQGMNCRLFHAMEANQHHLYVRCSRPGNVNSQMTITAYGVTPESAHSNVMLKIAERLSVESDANCRSILMGIRIFVETWDPVAITYPLRVSPDDNNTDIMVATIDGFSFDVEGFGSTAETAKEDLKRKLQAMILSEEHKTERSQLSTAFNLHFTTVRSQRYPMGPAPQQEPADQAIQNQSPMRARRNIRT